MNRLMITILLAGIFLSCKTKKEEKSKGQYFSVFSYLNAQAKNIDTSGYHIIKIETVDSTSDTSAISKEEFRNYASDFLQIPDISSADEKDDYEESNTYDPDLNRILLTYTAKDPDAPVQRETVLLEPADSGDSRIATIIIDRIRTNKDSVIVKNMLWEVNRQFQVITKTQVNETPEKIKTLVVRWQ